MEDVVWLEREAAFWETQRSDHAERLRRIIGYVRERERLREALSFYADPYTYHLEILGVCGLADDEDDFEGGSFGKRAREALRSSESDLT